MNATLDIRYHCMAALELYLRRTELCLYGGLQLGGGRNTQELAEAVPVQKRIYKVGGPPAPFAPRNPQSNLISHI
jgi:hypothetical protein